MIRFSTHYGRPQSSTHLSAVIGSGGSGATTDVSPLICHITSTVGRCNVSPPSCATPVPHRCRVQRYTHSGILPSPSSSMSHVKRCALCPSSLYTVRVQRFAVPPLLWSSIPCTRRRSAHALPWHVFDIQGPRRWSCQAQSALFNYEVSFPLLGSRRVINETLVQSDIL